MLGARYPTPGHLLTRPLVPLALVAIKEGVQQRRQPTVRQLANRRVQNDWFSPPLYHSVKNLHSFSRLGS